MILDRISLIWDVGVVIFDRVFVILDRILDRILDWIGGSVRPSTTPGCCLGWYESVSILQELNSA